MYSPEEYQLKKFIQKNKKLQRQIAEYNEKTLLKSEKEEIKHQSKETKKNISELYKQRQLLFAHTNKCENELIAYIALLNARMYRDQSLSSEQINEKYKENLGIVRQFQEIKKWELNLSKNELEGEIMESFALKEKEQNEKLDRKIEEQIKVFEQMERTKKELADIKNDFVTVNKMFEKQVIINDKLKLDKQLKEIENKGYNEMLQRLQAQQSKLVHKYNNVFDTFLNISSITNSDDDSFNENVIKEGSELYLTKKSKTSSISMTQMEKSENFEESIKEEHKEEYTEEFFQEVIQLLKNKIEESKKIAHEQLYTNSLLTRDRGNLKILIEKCLEDLNYDYKKVNNEIKRKVKGNYASMALSNESIVGIGLAKLKRQLNLIEKNLYKISYIHDNCFAKAKRIKRSQSTVSISSIDNRSRRLSV